MCIEKPAVPVFLLFSLCRGAGNRTRAARSQTVYTTIMLHPEISWEDISLSAILSSNLYPPFYTSFTLISISDLSTQCEAGKWTLYFDTSIPLFIFTQTEWFLCPKSAKYTTSPEKMRAHYPTSFETRVASSISFSVIVFPAS